MTATTNRVAALVLAAMIAAAGAAAVQAVSADVVLAAESGEVDQEFS